MRVNLGCGDEYLEGWVNVDERPETRADVHADGIEFVRRHGPQISELYLGHLVEHLREEDAAALLHLAATRLPEGAVVSAVTPDMAAIFQAYLDGEIDNRTLNFFYVYSYVQPSHHAWCHDETSLHSLFDRAGLIDIEPVDIGSWEPVAYKTGEQSRWQCGVRGRVRARSAEPALVPTRINPEGTPAAGVRSNGAAPAAAAGPETALAELIAEATRLRGLLDELDARHITALEALRDCDRSVVLQLRSERDQLRSTLAGIESSIGWRLAHRASLVSRRILPGESRRRQLLRRVARTLRSPDR